MNNLDKKTKTIVTIVGTILLFIIGIFLMGKDNSKEIKYEEYLEENNLLTDMIPSEEEKIKVHVTGEVNNKGIIEIEEGSRISDLIEAAGGSTNEADLNEINLAYKLEDGQKVYIPNINDVEVEEYITEDSGKAEIKGDKKAKLVNINTATQTELETLSGIGPSMALRIITYREQNGKFKDIEELKNISGIGDAKFNSIKDYICVK